MLNSLLHILKTFLIPHKGELTRGEYISITSLLILPVIIWIVTTLQPMVADLTSFQPGQPISTPSLPNIEGLMVMLVPLIYVTLTTTAQRLRNGGKNPWLTLLVLTPYVGLAMQMYAVFLPNNAASTPKVKR